MTKKLLTAQLLAWYFKENRELPWRSTYDPYHVWISEIMLQQTQMERGVQYFLRWIEHFPNVEAVACASEDEVLKLWEGLGYYARARNLRKAAQRIVADYNGVVPADFDQLLTLPGIGLYTASAVASIAGGQDIPVIDANVNRIIARLYNIEKSIKSASAQRLIISLVKGLLAEIDRKGRARHFNQAMMDFGGLICKPRDPKCGECVIKSHCISHRLGVVDERPVMPQKKKTIHVHRIALLLVSGDKVLLQQRVNTKLWSGLWELPGREIENSEHISQEILNSLPEYCGCGAFDTINLELIARVKHQYTHHKVQVAAYLGKLEKITSVPEHGQWVTFAELANYGFPAGTRKIFEYIRTHSPSLLGNVS